MNNSETSQFTISLADISMALGVSRTTVWRLFRGREMLHARVHGRKYFTVADVIIRLRQRPNHDPEIETTLLSIDQQRRQIRQHEAQRYDV